MGDRVQESQRNIRHSPGAGCAARLPCRVRRAKVRSMTTNRNGIKKIASKTARIRPPRRVMIPVLSSAPAMLHEPQADDKPNATLTCYFTSVYNSSSGDLTQVLDRAFPLKKSILNIPAIDVQYPAPV